MNLEPLKFYLGQRIHCKEKISGGLKVVGCDGTFKHTREFAGILAADGMVEELRRRGHDCDCEVLMGREHG